ncbi:MAG: VCBS repeat-containing protein, partial [Candidatus Heimdallarchaeota archaeon]
MVKGFKNKIITGFLVFTIVCMIFWNSSTEAMISDDSTSYSIDIDFSNLLFQVEWVYPLEWSSETPCIIDLDRDGVQEILTTGFCLSSTGELKWSKPTLASSPQSSCVVADIDNDNYVEIIYALSGQIYVMNHDSSYKWDYTRTDDNSLFTSPCIADVDGDKLFEIITSTHWDGLFCISNEGELQWQHTFSISG